VRNGIGKSVRTVMAWLLLLVMLAVPVAPSAANPHFQSPGSCDQAFEGGHDHTVHTAVQQNRSILQADDQGCADMDGADIQCCVGAQCVFMHGGLPASGALLLTGPPLAELIPALSRLLDGVEPDPALHPPRSSV
jgi:hypothetical protein